MVDQPLGLIQNIETPRDRILFVRFVGNLSDVVDVDSLAVVELSAEGLADARVEGSDEPIATRYTAELHGRLLGASEDVNRVFVVRVVFVRLDARDGEDAKLALESLRVELKTNDGSLPGDGTADITDYTYDPGIAGVGRVPMDKFPIEWRDRVADVAMAKSLESVALDAADLKR